MHIQCTVVASITIARNILFKPPEDKTIFSACKFTHTPPQSPALQSTQTNTINQPSHTLYPTYAQLQLQPVLKAVMPLLGIDVVKNHMGKEIDSLPVDQQNLVTPI